MFPSWEAVERYREVVLFVAGQMKDSRPLVQFIYQMQVERGESIDADLFKWLHSEATVRLFDDPLHNKYINYYNHDPERGDPTDTTPVFSSRLYHFAFMMKDIVLGEYKEQRAEIPECAMFLHRPNVTVTKSLLSTCRTISEHQAVTDLWMFHVDCDDATEAEAPILSRNIQSLYIFCCKLPSSFMRNILRQLHDCVTLTNLKLSDMDFREVEEDLDKLLDNLVSNHEKGLSQEKLTISITISILSEEFAAKWKSCCEGITSIECIIIEY